MQAVGQRRAHFACSIGTAEDLGMSTQQAAALVYSSIDYWSRRLSLVLNRMFGFHVGWQVDACRGHRVVYGGREDTGGVSASAKAPDISQCPINT
jgi:hypothetical protein